MNFNNNLLIKSLFTLIYKSRLNNHKNRFRFIFEGRINSLQTTPSIPPLSFQLLF